MGSGGNCPQFRGSAGDVLLFYLLSTTTFPPNSRGVLLKGATLEATSTLLWLCEGPCQTPPQAHPHTHSEGPLFFRLGKNHPALWPLGTTGNVSGSHL